MSSTYFVHVARPTRKNLALTGPPHVATTSNHTTTEDGQPPTPKKKSQPSLPPRHGQESTETPHFFPSHLDQTTTHHSARRAGLPGMASLSWFQEIPRTLLDPSLILPTHVPTHHRSSQRLNHEHKHTIWFNSDKAHAHSRHRGYAQTHTRSDHELPVPKTQQCTANPN